MRIDIHPGARTVIDRLRVAGFEAYAVGGCVRDALLGRTADDWDICTSARPEQTERVFSDLKTIDIGRKHGTIAVLLDRKQYEITTFRADGGYEDARHPTSVSFDTTLSGDLMRRDFTINAMAAGADGEVVDLFGGQSDLENRIIRCVGDPSARFSEDALRILRALRFAATLGGFDLDGATASAARKLAPLIEKISGERILVELNKLLCGVDAERILLDYPDVLAAAIPEIAPCIGFEHRNSWHCFDVWEHICRTIALAPPEPQVRLALLFHDIAKPQCAVEKPNGHRSFHGHAEAGEPITRARLDALHASKALRERTAELVLMHDDPLSPDRALVGRYLRKLGAEGFFQLCDVELADALAHNMEIEGARKRVSNVRATAALARKMLAENAPYAPSMLAIHGDELDVPPSERGKLLERLCDDVLSGEVENERQALLERAKDLI